ncbi:type III restriction-modification system endonuclease [Moraxella nasovis]|uniref:type III restriction-modification system endonuclease n=1 Tax=Moraxella nasovis TaxID=2904121 RepID=UPI001F61BB9B|nr:type III restriction-modification system endonuclease [Moraxella nasovis]UNU73843.1 type III restriction-modification system endonuclease [Moraxella nasovis]
MGFHYEKELPHQIGAINAVLGVFNGANKIDNSVGENPTLGFSASLYRENIQKIQSQNQLDKQADFSNVLDIAMETGTGKTYTYTQTMYEMHRLLGVNKFVIVVPTLSIKAGTEQFLKSDALREHFRLDFDGKYGQAQIKLYVVESQKTKKGKRGSPMPSEIVQFVQADNAKQIHVLLLNMGMVNSKTMKGEDSGNDGSILLNDKFDKPFEAIGSVKPILIIDEPHRFDDSNKTWQSLMSLKPQFILRYGATFNDKFKNLIYRLSAIDAFNQDLVKGVVAHIQEVQGDNKTSIKFIGKTDTDDVIFELNENGKKQTFTLSKGDSLKHIHHAIDDLVITDIHAKKSLVVLNGEFELQLNETFKPYSYANLVTDTMISQAVRTHFDNEKILLNRDDKIKPLTLFFIDDIKGYRDGDNVSGSLKNRFEQIVQVEAERALQTAEVGTAFYRSLQTVLKDVSATHGGYFSKDNSTDDENIAQQISEILHDKESLLSLNNPRRFIFSKWTLREGWDNPNVFGICKLRSSGSDTSKLQEVGRGLRLPVNEYMSRVKNSDFKLHYFVDSSESDFVETLKAEINQSGEREVIPTALNDDLFVKIQNHYDESKKQIRQKLADLLDDDDNLVGDDVLAQLKAIYPLAFTAQKLKGDKITNVNDKRKNTANLRVGKYDELKDLWKAINQKAILRYEMTENQTLDLFKAFLVENQSKFTATGIAVKTQTLIKIDENTVGFKEIASVENAVFEPINTLNYREFLQKLAQQSYIKIQTLHQAFYELQDTIEIGRFLNDDTIRFIVGGFDGYLLQHSLSKFEIGYQKISGQIHPTKLTDKQGNALPEIEINQDWGVLTDEKPLDNFLFDRVFFDSQIEKQNIVENNGVDTTEIIVFTKIPKNAIKIPVAGGKTYSPDFAYIVKTAKGETLNLVIESKGVADESGLRQFENQKIKHAQRWFSAMNEQSGIDVKFVTQFEQEKIKDIIQKLIIK